MRWYNIVQSDCNTDRSVIVNHEPMKQSEAYEGLEILRRSYQFMGFDIIHDVTGFIVADGAHWITRFSKEENKV